MGSLRDTLLQNALSNPVANKPVLQSFPSFGPMQFAVGGAFAQAALWGLLALGPAWTAAITVIGLVIFWVKTRNRTHCPGRGA